jgi:hypothetical protein
VDERARRIGENEDLFRKVNEQVHTLSEDFDVSGESITIICECGEQSCIAQLSLNEHEYRNLRADPTHFAVVPGHEKAGVEHVVLETSRYNVVEKAEGGPSRLAEALDD